MKTKKKYNPLQSAKDAIRKVFFENGGTPKQWIGNPVSIPNKKRKKNKEECRHGQVNWKSE